METELEKALRRIKPGRHKGTLSRRPDSELPFVGIDEPPHPLLIDTTVYVDTLEGTLPPEAEKLLEIRSLFHHTVALGELAHLFGRLKPDHDDTASHLDELAGVIGDIPAHRLESTTSPRVMIEAGIVNGLMFRLGGSAPGQEVAALNDATLYLHALHRGYTVLTRNIRDFDFINQIVPAGRMLFYRRI
ncbi:type II toxin-antitoxin system VapC family toxin [Skermanella pratensis]|uniref:type II toxin-antitoxin system VapC family toxin n=1 Tax=Skermanella pratensis TaxID=2233999 RepID=UPI001300D78C|nr:type II toxin-antitoxin system VapC family toxin [Skermanella pratensis]